MKTRTIGRSGLEVSLVGLGCNNLGGRLDQAASDRVVAAALEHGVTLFDVADIYGGKGGSEIALGKALGAKRKDIVLASKFGSQQVWMDDVGRLKGGSRRYIIQALEASLRRLDCDWIDLYQIHDPDPLTPIEETLRALEDCIRGGKLRYVGCSNFSAWQLVEAQLTARSINTNSFVSAQYEYSVIARDVERELGPLMRRYGIGLLPYFPLASGMLAGRYRRGQKAPEGSRMTKAAFLVQPYLNDVTFDKVEKLEVFCADRDRTLLQLAMSWLAAQSSVSSVIAGASSPEQVAQNAKAIDWTLTTEDLCAIDAITASVSNP